LNKPGVIVIEGHVQGLSNTRSLGRSGVPVVVVDTGRCVARRSRYCRDFYRCPGYDSDDLADFLIRLGEVKGLEGWLLLPSNDHAVLTISRNKSRLERFYRVITPEMAVVENIYDKARLLGAAEAAGVPVPATYYPKDAGCSNFPLAFPVLTRGRFGVNFYKATGRKAFLAGDIRELRGQLEHIAASYPIQDALVQELIPDDGTNRTISFTAFCEQGEIRAFWMGEKVREHPVRFGTATFARSVYVNECRDLAVPLLKALDYNGVCEVEFLKDPGDGRYKLIEINARTWLWVGLARACGVDFAKMAYAHANGMDVQYPQNYETGVCWINPLTDVAYALHAMLKGRITAGQYLRSLFNGRKVDALFERGDWKPGLAYMLNIFSYLGQR